MFSLENKKIIALDGKNGVTYIGKNTSDFFDRLFYHITIEDYVVKPTAKLESTDKNDFAENAMEAYENFKKVSSTIRFKDKEIQTIHWLR